MIGAAKVLTRVVSQARKELIQIFRSPAAFVSLVLGPFLLMALFGLGFTGIRAPLVTALVIPPELDLPRDVAFYQQLTGPGLHVVEIVESPEAPLQALRERRLDMVVIAPADALRSIREGAAAQIQVAVNEVDPAIDLLARILAGDLSQAVNQELIERALEEGENYVLARLEAEAEVLVIPPDVLAAPTIAVTVNLAPTPPSIVAFFAPAVLALVLQHMAVTMSALSLVRERRSGTMELFRISPISPTELILGKYLGFGVATSLLAAAVLGLVVFGLGVPLLGSPIALAAVVALVIFASLGIGLLISVIADSERQAVQLSMLVLLASVFFGGVVQRVEDLRPVVQAVSYALPVTHGITLLQGVMLRGESGIDASLIALAGIGIAMLLVTSLLLRRQFAQSVRG